MTISIAELMTESGVKFGTSGARGLADAISDRVAYCYTVAFLRQQVARHAAQGGPVVKAIVLGGDLRPSTPRIMAAIGAASQAEGFKVTYAGFVPSPAVVLEGIRLGALSIMVTGSHIPDDRNGIKFNRADGEIDKSDEVAIKASSLELDESLFVSNGALATRFGLGPVNAEVGAAYQRRFVDFFPEQCLAGLRVGVYQHSTVGRQQLVDTLRSLGATVTALGFSDQFIPVDTEALRPEDVVLARDWAADGSYHAIVSADGDCDRPLLADEKGKWLRGDVLGVLCAQFFGAKAVATPVSCNSVVEKCGAFQEVTRTKIGSPYVIAAMQKLSAAGVAPVVGYEANGGFLQESTLPLAGKVLSALPTRDAFLPIIGVLLRAKQEGVTISALVDSLPQRFTASDRVKEFPTELSRQKIAELYDVKAPQAYGALEQAFGSVSGKVESVDTTDGLRVVFENQEVIHMRPSGNAPELRCYTEASAEARALELNALCMGVFGGWR